MSMEKKLSDLEKELETFKRQLKLLILKDTDKSKQIRTLKNKVLELEHSLSNCVRKR